MDKQLSDWTLNYVKNKDLTFRKLVKYTEQPKEEYIDFEFKDKKVAHFIMDKVSDKMFDVIKNHDHKIIVCLNTEDNFKFLIKNWNIRRMC